MPLTINVGLNRKASRDYQSTGASINIQAELDGALLARPAELQAAIESLYAEARAALDRQTGEPAPAEKPREPRRPTNGNGYQHVNRFAGRNGNGSGHAMTERQKRAIQVIGRERGIDPYQSARDTFHVDFDALTARQASELIDNLRA